MNQNTIARLLDFLPHSLIAVLIFILGFVLGSGPKKDRRAEPPEMYEGKVVDTHKVYGAFGPYFDNYYVTVERFEDDWRKEFEVTYEEYLNCDYTSKDANPVSINMETGELKRLPKDYWSRINANIKN
jgi:hypothetical protein